MVSASGMKPVVLVNCTGETLTTSASGGIATWVLGVHAAARRTGANVQVVTKRHPGVDSALADAVVLDYPRGAPVPGLARLDRGVRGLLGYPHVLQPVWNRQVCRALRELGPAPKYLVFHNDPELAVVAARRFPQHEVAHVLHNTNGLAGRWRRPFETRVRALAISDFVARWSERDHGFPRGSVRTVHNGVDDVLFRPRRRLRAGPTVVTYVGLFNRRKAPDLLLEAALHLAGDVPPFEVRLIGSTHYGRDEADLFDAEIRRLSDDLRYRGVQVVLTGFLGRPELARQLSDTDVIVVPSRWEEPFSLAALEGMASGAAVVAADTGGLPEAVGPGAALFRLGDSRHLAEQLRPLLTTPSHLGQRQREALAWAQMHTWGTTWSRLCALLQEPTLEVLG